MKSPVKCPACGAEGSIYGLPYGLQIGSSIKGQNSDVHGTILIQCEKCGAVLGGYKHEIQVKR